MWNLSVRTMEIYIPATTRVSHKFSYYQLFIGKYGLKLLCILFQTNLGLMGIYTLSNNNNV